MAEVKGLAPGSLAGLEHLERDLAFPPAEYKERLHRLRALMAEAKIDLLWITTPEAAAWLHGLVCSWYKGNSPMRYPQLYGTAVHVDSDEFIFFDAPFEAPVLAKNSVSTDNRFFTSREADDNLAFIKNELAAKGWLKGNVGLEFWSYLPNPAVSKMFEALFSGAGCTVVDGSATVRRARRVKSPREIAVLERAARIAEAGHKRIKAYMREGITELDLFGECVNAMAKEGGELSALIPVFNATPILGDRPVLTGHTMAGRKKIRAGEVLKADICGVFHRYHANVERCYTIGEPPKGLVDRYTRAAGVFDVIRTEVKSGMTVAEAIKILRRYYEDVGLWDQPGWGLGYELGISLPPDWVGEFYYNVRDTKYLDRVFEPNMVTNFESNFDTGLIDTVVYTPQGTRVLSDVPLELIVADA
ncbi:MAG: M24 family metallopeptidase [Alphaproteobacteria bacterium]